ncbi:MAG: GntR family transcriptional regulator [Acetobacteraceae bacterium]|nr:GntR family transcriptional regulator [Acetobacteraceae bacterium]
MKPTPTPIEPATTLATSVYARLRDDLLRGALPPGSKLRVEWLAAQYGVGASPVREALNRLAAERLLDRHDQRGFYARMVTLADLEELTRTRCWLEERALRESIAHRDAAWEEEVVLTLHRLNRTARRNEAGDEANPQWEVLHRAFHRALIANCRSHWLLEFCGQLADHAYLYRQLAQFHATEPRDEISEHDAIARHAIAGDVDAAVAALMAHYQRTSALCRVGMTG